MKGAVVIDDPGPEQRVPSLGLLQSLPEAVRSDPRLELRQDERRQDKWSLGFRDAELPAPAVFQPDQALTNAAAAEAVQQ